MTLKVKLCYKVRRQQEKFTPHSIFQGTKTKTKEGKKIRKKISLLSPLSLSRISSFPENLVTLDEKKFVAFSRMEKRDECKVVYGFY